MAEEYTYLGPLETEGYERVGDLEKPEPGYLERVGTRLSAVPGRIMEGVTAKPITGGTAGRGAESMKVLGALGAMFEPLLAPVGEAGRALGSAIGEQYLKTGIAPGAEGVAPEQVDVSNVTSGEAKAVREGAGEAYSIGAEAVAGFSRPVANLGAKLGWNLPLMSRRVTPVGQKMIDMMGYDGIRVAQATESRMFDIMDSVASASLIGGGKMAKHTKSQAKLVEEIADSFAGTLGMHVKDPQVRGFLLKMIAEGSDDMYRAAGNRLFKEVDAFAPTPAVDLTSVYNIAKDMLNKYPEDPHTTSIIKYIIDKTKPVVSTVQSPMGILGPLGQPLTTSQTVAKPMTTTFLEANDLRSLAYGWKTPGATAAGDQAARVASILGKEVDLAIDAAGAAVNPRARQALQVARDYWKGESATFNRRAIRKIINDGNLPPEAIIGTFIKPGALTETQAFAKMLGGVDSPAWGVVRRSFVEDMLEKSQTFDKVAGQAGLDGGKLQVELGRWGATAKEVLGGHQAEYLKDIAEIASQAQLKGGGPGSMYIQLTQGGVFAGLLSAGLQASAGVILLGPKVIAYILTSPQATKWLVEGLRMQRGSAGAIRTAGLLSNFLQPGRRASDEPKSSELEKMFFGGSAK